MKDATRDAVRSNLRTLSGMATELREKLDLTQPTTTALLETLKILGSVIVTMETMTKADHPSRSDVRLRHGVADLVRAEMHGRGHPDCMVRVDDCGYIEIQTPGAWIEIMHWWSMSPAEVVAEWADRAQPSAFAGSRKKPAKTTSARGTCATTGPVDKGSR